MISSRIFQRKLINTFHRTHVRRLTVLGIETSCDDTGCAIVNDRGQVLGECLKSQTLVHLRNGGIIPPIARDLHVEAIEDVVQEAIKQSRLAVSDIDAVAATVKPGLSLSLLVGARFGQKLAKDFNKPFIPIHHMEAHALAVRMKQQVEFPFLVLLISGGHCLLAVAQDVDKFLLLGQSNDDAPGEAFDKVARRMKLTNLAEYRSMGGGQAIERAARGGDPTTFPFSAVMCHYRDCNFSFSGIKSMARRHIIRQETQFEVAADGVIPGYQDLCASFQHAVSRHLGHRVQRAMEFIALKQLIPIDKQTLVISGGVACNQYITRTLSHITNERGYQLAVPPPSLCTDNGLMIAWNGMERWRRKLGIVASEDAHTIDVEARCTFGVDASEQVVEADIKCDWIKLPVEIPSSKLEQRSSSTSE